MVSDVGFYKAGLVHCSGLDQDVLHCRLTALFRSAGVYSHGPQGNSKAAEAIDAPGRALPDRLRPPRSSDAGFVPLHPSPGRRSDSTTSPAT